MSYDLHKHESLLSNDVLCQAWLKIVIINCGIFRNFKICFPLGKGCGPLFKEIWIPFTQGCFLPSLAVWFWRWPFSFNVFTITLLSLLERGYGPFFEQTRMNSIYTGYPLQKLELARWFWKKIFFTTACISLWKRVWHYIWNKDYHWQPYTLYQVLLKLARRF